MITHKNIEDLDGMKVTMAVEYDALTGGIAQSKPVYIPNMRITITNEHAVFATEPGTGPSLTIKVPHRNVQKIILNHSISTIVNVDITRYRGRTQ